MSASKSEVEDSSVHPHSLLFQSPQRKQVFSSNSSAVVVAANTKNSPQQQTNDLPAVLCKCQAGTITLVCMEPSCLNSNAFLLCKQCSQSSTHQTHEQTTLSTLIHDIIQFQTTQQSQSPEKLHTLNSQRLLDVRSTLQTARETLNACLSRIDTMISEVSTSIDEQHSKKQRDYQQNKQLKSKKNSIKNEMTSYSSLSAAIQDALNDIFVDPNHQPYDDHLQPATLNFYATTIEQLKQFHTSINAICQKQLILLSNYIRNIFDSEGTLLQQQTMPISFTPTTNSMYLSRMSERSHQNSKQNNDCISDKSLSPQKSIEKFNEFSALNESRLLQRNSIYEDESENIINQCGEMIDNDSYELTTTEAACAHSVSAGAASESGIPITSEYTKQHHPRFEFSRTMRDPNIELHRRQIVNGRYVKGNHYRVALMQPELESVIPCIKQWSFKITRQQPHWLAFGMCLVEDTKKRSFMFTDNEFTFSSEYVNKRSNAHGCFMITTHGWMFADSAQPIRSSLRFAKNDIVTCRFDPFKQLLIFYKNYEYNIPACVQFKPVCWNKLYPCVVMWHSEDAVELL